MAIDMFETRTMLRMLEQRKPPKRFLLDLFFSATKRSLTRHVDIDIYDGQRRMAPFVNPRGQGTLVERIGFQTKTFTPPYVKPKMVTEAEDIMHRMAGEHIYAGGRTPGQLASERLGQDLAELEDMIVRREEWMASQALNGGIIQVVGEGVDAEIDFQMPANQQVTLSGTDLWTDAGSDPVADIRDWRRRVAQRSGLTPNRAVIGSDVEDALLNNERFQTQLDNRRFQIGEARLEAAGAMGGRLVAVLNDGFQIWAYDEWYVDPDTGDEEAMVPADTVFMGSTQARTARHYGAIRDVRAMAAVDRFPKSWITEDPSARWVMLQSAPLVVPHQIGGFLVAQAV